MENEYLSRINQLAFVGSELVARDLVSEANVIAETVSFLIESQNLETLAYHTDFVVDFFNELHIACYSSWMKSVFKSQVPEPVNYNVKLGLVDA